MRPVQTVRRLLGNAWYVAAPLLLVLGIVALLLLLKVVHAIVSFAAGPDAADNVLADVMIVIVWGLMLAAVGAVVYGLFRATRWLLARRA